MATSPPAEFAIDETGLRALLRIVAPKIATLPLSFVAEGWDNAIWRIGSDLAARLPRRELAVGPIYREQAALPRLAPLLQAENIDVPAPLLTVAPTDIFPWPWSIVPWLPGRPALEATREANTSWAPHLARAVLTLHRLDITHLAQNPFRGVPLTERDDDIRARLASLDAETSRALDRIWRLGVETVPSAESVCIHGDLHPGNMLIDHGRLTALIDFGDVTNGDPAYDLATSWLTFNARGRRIFRNSTADRYDGNTWTRAKAWAAAISATLLHASDNSEIYRSLGRQTAFELLHNPE